MHLVRLQNFPKNLASYPMISKFLPHDTHTIWDKLPKCIFESFVEIAGVKQGHFQNFQKPQG